MNKCIIGKIPGYNNNIDSENKYRQNLLYNLTKIRLTPIGFKFQQNAILNFKNGEVSKNLYKITGEGITLLGDKDDKDKLSLIGAIQIWKNLINSSRVGELRNILSPEVTMLEILATNDSTLVETFSTSYGENSLDKISNKLSNIDAIKTISTITKGTSSLSSTAGLNILQNLGGNSIQELIAKKALNIQAAWPKEWEKSNYNNQINIMIKLVSPSGDEESIKYNIIKPLTYLMLATSPITTDGLFSGYPPLWEVKADGLMGMKVAGISNMTITRGGVDTQFNKDNQPLNVDVRLTLTPIINGFASPYSISSSDSGEINASSLYKNNDNLAIQTPKEFMTSFGIKLI